MFLASNACPQNEAALSPSFLSKPTHDTITAGITNLDNLITAFQNSPGTLSAADQAALDGIQAASQALVTKADAVSVVPPVAPPGV